MSNHASSPRGFARALLRLYPRAWRERYGEEWLTLVGDHGLTPRVVVDVIGAAALERLRGFVAWRRRETDPSTLDLLVAKGPGREFLVEWSVYCVLVVLTVAALSRWFHWPVHWSFWFYVLWPWLRVMQFAGLGTSRSDRIASVYYRFAESAAISCAIVLGAHRLAAAGLPRPNDDLAELIIFSVVIPPLVRFVFAWWRGWDGMSPGEWVFWKVLLFSWIGWTAYVDDRFEGYWFATAMLFMFCRLPSEMRRDVIAHRRSLRAALEERMRIEFPIKPGGYF